MDIGKILRERADFPAYRGEPKKPGKRWGVFPSVKVDQAIFHEDDEFRCTVSLFSHDANEILRMQDETISAAAKGMKKDGWDFWLHAANHKVQRVQGLYRSEINFVFKVLFPETTHEEVK